MIELQFSISTTQAVLLVAIALIVVVGMRLLVGSEARRILLERKPLMTKREFEFFQRLKSVLPGHDVHCQVSMGALLRPARGLNKAQFWKSRNAISQKIIDFAIGDRSTGEVLALIELDDRSHNYAKDAFRDAMLAEGGYRVIRFPAGALLTETLIRDHLHFLFQSGQDGGHAPMEPIVASLRRDAKAL